MLGAQIRMHRKSKGLSQEELAELAGVHNTFISSIERGRASTSTYIIFRIARALEIRLESLFGFLEITEDEANIYNQLACISETIRKMDDPHRTLCIAAIKGMISE